MNLSGRHKNGRGRPPRPAGVSVRGEQPTTATKAQVAALVTVLGLVGIHITTGTAQAIVMVAQLALVFYGVWRVRNRRKTKQWPGVGEFL